RSCPVWRRGRALWPAAISISFRDRRVGRYTTILRRCPAPSYDGPAPSGGIPPVLLRADEPGIGKTRLLHAAATRAKGCGLRVPEGRLRSRVCFMAVSTCCSWTPGHDDASARQRRDGTRRYGPGNVRTTAPLCRSS